MDLQLKDRVVLVTGGAKGIGAAIVRSCAEEGAIPVIVDRDQQAGEELEGELKIRGAASAFLPADLVVPANCSAAVEESARRFGHLDALVNNAGINDRVGLESGGPETISGMAATKPAALLQHGVLRAAASETQPRLDRQHQFQDGGDWAGRNLGLCRGQGSDPGLNTGVGSRPAALRYSRQFRRARRGRDAAVPRLNSRIASP